MGSSTDSTRLVLRWNDFDSHLKKGFRELRQNEDFCDVSLACDSRVLQAHKVILSASSSLFKSLLQGINSQSHPLLYLRGIQFSLLESLLNFMYNGEVSVSQENLHEFLFLAEELQVEGLTTASTANNNATPPSSSSSSSHEEDKGPSCSFFHETESRKIKGKSLKRSRKESPFPQKSSNRVCNVKDEELETPLQDDDVIIESDDVRPENDESSIGEYGDYGSENGDDSYGNDVDGVDNSICLPELQDIEPESKGDRNVSQELDEQLLLLIKKIGVNTFACLKCGKESHYKNNLKAHIEAKHFITNGFPCSSCTAWFKTRDSLRKHVRKHKNEPIAFSTL